MYNKSQNKIKYLNVVYELCERINETNIDTHTIDYNVSFFPPNANAINQHHSNGECFKFIGMCFYRCTFDRILKAFALKFHLKKALWIRKLSSKSFSMKAQCYELWFFSLYLKLRSKLQAFKVHPKVESFNFLLYRFLCNFTANHRKQLRCCRSQVKSSIIKLKF